MTVDVTRLVPVRVEVVDWLVAALRARPGLAGVQVNDARPRDPANEHITFWETRGVDGGITHMQPGRKQRHDRFELGVFIGAMRPGQDPAAAKTRAAFLFDELEDFLAENPTRQGINSIQRTTFNGPDAGPVSDEGYGGFVEVVIVVDTYQI